MKYLLPLLLACFYGFHQVKAVTGRLDSYENIGFMTPKSVFQLEENAYFVSYLDLTSDNITSAHAQRFRVNMWNGGWLVMYENGNYLPPGMQTNLIIGDGNSNLRIAAVLNLDGTLFQVPMGSKKFVNFALNMQLTFDDNHTEFYEVFSVIAIENNYVDPTTGTTGEIGTTGQLPTTGTTGQLLTTGTTGQPLTTGTTGQPQTTGTTGQPLTTGTTGRLQTTGTTGQLQTTGTTGRPQTTGTTGRPQTTGTTRTSSTTGTTGEESSASKINVKILYGCTYLLFLAMLAY